MTPVIFVSFLISLALVDYQNRLRRSHYHAKGRESGWLPRWLHCMVYRSCTRRTCHPAGKNSQAYYQSNQRQLLELEADEAFEMRGSVVALLGCGAMFRMGTLAACQLGTCVFQNSSGEISSSDWRWKDDVRNKKGQIRKTHDN